MALTLAEISTYKGENDIGVYLVTRGLGWLVVVISVYFQRKKARIKLNEDIQKAA